MSEAITLVCVPVSADALIAHGSEKRNCGHCGTAVWVAPSGVDLIAQRGATPVCLACAAATITPEDEFVALSDRQLAEAAAALEGHRRRN